MTAQTPAQLDCHDLVQGQWLLRDDLATYGLELSAEPDSDERNGAALLAIERIGSFSLEDDGRVLINPGHNDGALTTVEDIGDALDMLTNPEAHGIRL